MFSKIRRSNEEGSKHEIDGCIYPTSNFENILNYYNILFSRQLNYGQIIDYDAYQIIKKHNGMIAGGAIVSFITNAKINDIDVYFKSEYDKNECLNAFHDKKYPIKYTSKYATSFDVNGFEIQLITRYTAPTIENLINDFDLNLCAVGYDTETDSLHMTTHTLDDIMCRKVRLLSYDLKNPINTMYRIFKYMDRGYEINHLDIMKICIIINNMEFKTYDDLLSTLKGVSDYTLDTISKNLKENTSGDLYSVKETLAALDKAEQDVRDKKDESLMQLFKKAKSSSSMVKQVQVIQTARGQDNQESNNILGF